MTNREKIEELKYLIETAKEAQSDPIYRAEFPLTYAQIPSIIKDAEQQIKNLELA